MHLISIRYLRSSYAKYPDAMKAVEDWHTTIKQADWKSLDDVRQIYRDADAVGNFTVFNLKGNRYRLIVGIDYGDGTIYFKYFFHAEYSKDEWKNDPYF